MDPSANETAAYVSEFIHELVNPKPVGPSRSV